MTDTTNLNSAVATVMGEVRRLKKADNNAFAKYRYTSVDDFKDALRPLLAEAGLSVSMNELSSEFVTYAKSKTEESTAVKFQFSVTLRHESGEAAIPERISVTLPFVGAQTTGQARSYALKEYLKSEFMASSGDSEDADQAPEDMGELSRAEAKPIYAELQAELDEVAGDGLDAMNEWAQRRLPSLNILPKDWKLKLRARFEEYRAAGKTTQIDEDVDDDADAYDHDANVASANAALDRQFAETVG